MSEQDNKQQNSTQPSQAHTVPAAASAAPAAADAGRSNRPDRRGTTGSAGAGARRNPRRGGRSDAKTRPEFDQKIIDIRRVARVVAGGRRFSFSVALVIGDHKGQVGVGLGKAGDTALAIEKAMKNAKKHLVKVPVTKSMSIPYEISSKYNASRVTLTPTPGRGIVAGSSVRSIIELAGLKDVGAKLRSGSKNRLNNARVALKALGDLRPHRLSRRVAASSVAAVQ